MTRSPITKILASLFTLIVLTAGYASFGIWTTMVFASGFLTGLILWLFIPSAPPYASIKIPYWCTLAAFVLLHRVEENVMDFQPALSKITGTPVPGLTSVPLISLLVLSVGA